MHTSSTFHTTMHHLRYVTIAPPPIHLEVQSRSFNDSTRQEASSTLYYRSLFIIIICVNISYYIIDLMQSLGALSRKTMDHDAGMICLILKPIVQQRSTARCRPEYLPPIVLRDRSTYMDTLRYLLRIIIYH